MTPTTIDKNQDKRNERRKQTAEDFTPSWLVKQMLDKLNEYNEDTWKDPRKTFIDPACGNGNFLVEIVKRKLKSGHKALDVAKTVFGLDIMQDNIQEARYRVCRVFDMFNELDENVVLLIWKNVRRVDDTLGVDFNKAVFKSKKAEKAKLTLIVRKVQEMNKDHKKVEVRRRFMKNYFYNNEHIQALQNIHTPFSLAKSMVKKLEGFTGLTDGKKYLCFNPEFVEALIGEGVAADNIWFISECQVKVSFVEQVCKGVHTMLDDFVSWKHGEKFDVVIGNPPFQELKEGNKKSKAIWPAFVKCAFEICKDNGYVCLIHPALWRQVEDKTGKLLKQKDFLYLEIHDIIDGKKVFGATTRYDWYVARNSNTTVETDIKDQNGVITRLNIKDYAFIPNKLITNVINLIAKNGEETVEVLHSYSAYETRKNWISKTQDATFKYPCLYYIPKNKEPSFWWSNTRGSGMFGVPKIIFPSGVFKSVGSVVDKEGEYGMTQFCFAIVEDKEVLDDIQKAMHSEEFIKINDAICVSKTELNRKALALFRKDFWKDFV